MRTKKQYDNLIKIRRIIKRKIKDPFFNEEYLDSFSSFKYADKIQYAICGTYHCILGDFAIETGALVSPFDETTRDAEHISDWSQIELRDNMRLFNNNCSDIFDNSFDVFGLEDYDTRALFGQMSQGSLTDRLHRVEQLINEGYLK